MKRLELKNRVSLLLFGSGFSALIYQIIWFREFRHIFGSSTASTAVVLAIFMGGLSLGSAFLGKRAEVVSNPIIFYSLLEAAISFFALVSPLLIKVASFIYISSGGVDNLGYAGASLLRIFLSIVILLPPTFCMGGTLPAVARGVTSTEDSDRKSLALLYGINTLGAVTGTVLSTFVLIEFVGILKTLITAALINILVSFLAYRVGRDVDKIKIYEQKDSDTTTKLPSVTILTVAAFVGFAFFAMELVWYRMLSPILGGTTYTFGSILTIVLLGIGIGGWLFSISKIVPSYKILSLTCLLEALFMILPFYLGDNLAVLAAISRLSVVLNFLYLNLGWFLIIFVVVFIPSLIAGFQFPLLVSIAGRGREGVASDTGWVYSVNTIGAIVGSLLGAFILIPALGAPNSWKLVVAILLLTGTLLIFKNFSTISLALAFLVAFFLTSKGPTSFWRHSGIGAGRFDVTVLKNKNNLKNFIYTTNRHIMWEKDGRESSVAIDTKNSLAFVVNGKVDGNAILDSITQVVSPLIGLALLDNPREVLIIGLGTGSSAGWAAEVSSVSRVDVVELEPAIKEVAKACSMVNKNVLSNKKVKIFYEDAREFLATTDREYDVIFSEPSNPYRAGIASLFTLEFYKAVAERVKENGLFLQWIQMYEVDIDVIATILNTLREVFPYLEMWQTQFTDLIVVASRKPINHNLTSVSKRINEYPFNEALENVLLVDGADGFYSMRIGNNDIANRLADSATYINTDNFPVVEFGFAKNVGAGRFFDTLWFVRFTASKGLDKVRDFPDSFWNKVLYARNLARIEHLNVGNSKDQILKVKYKIIREFKRKKFAEVERIIKSYPDISILHRKETLIISTSLALVGSELFPNYAKFLTRDSDRYLLEGVWHYIKGEHYKAAAKWQKAFDILRRDPWVDLETLIETLKFLRRLDKKDYTVVKILFESITKSHFALYNSESLRLAAAFSMLANEKLFEEKCVSFFYSFEPYPVWDKRFLTMRLRCYKNKNHFLKGRAEMDLEEFLSNAGMRYSF